MPVTWPAFFPENCPPDTAVPPDGVFYYLVPTATPSKNDFQPLAFRKPNKSWSNPAQKCQGCGLSIWNNREALLEKQADIPGFAGWLMARGHLSHEYGRLKQTGVHPSHHTWWLQEDLDPVPLFEVLP